MITSSGFLQIIRHTDLFTKILLCSLIGVAVLVIARAVTQLLVLSRYATYMRSVVRDVAACSTARELNTYIAQRIDHPSAQFLAMIVSLYAQVPTSEAARAALDEGVRQQVDDMVLYHERSLPLYAGAAAVAPLLGLFGTIWGLVHAFIEIHAAHTADLSAIAPGIAEALLTTLAGLIVAIPAMISYHLIASWCAQIEHAAWQLVTRVRLLYALSDER